MFQWRIYILCLIISSVTFRCLLSSKWHLELAVSMQLMLGLSCNVCGWTCGRQSQSLQKPQILFCINLQSCVTTYFERSARYTLHMQFLFFFCQILISAKQQSQTNRVSTFLLEDKIFQIITTDAFATTHFLTWGCFIWFSINRVSFAWWIRTS